MISDTLFESIEELRRYQREEPEMYDGCRAHIEEVIDVMEKLQRALDMPPEMAYQQRRMNGREMYKRRVSDRRNGIRATSELG